MPLEQEPQSRPPGSLFMLFLGALVGGVAGHAIACYSMPDPPSHVILAIELIPETWKWWVSGEIIGAGIVVFLYRKHLM